MGFGDFINNTVAPAFNGAKDAVVEFGQRAVDDIKQTGGRVLDDVKGFGGSVWNLTKESASFLWKDVTVNAFESAFSFFTDSPSSKTAVRLAYADEISAVLEAEGISSRATYDEDSDTFSYTTTDGNIIPDLSAEDVLLLSSKDRLYLAGVDAEVNYDEETGIFSYTADGSTISPLSPWELQRKIDQEVNSANTDIE